MRLFLLTVSTWFTETKTNFQVCCVIRFAKRRRDDDRLFFFHLKGTARLKVFVVLFLVQLSKRQVLSQLTLWLTKSDTLLVLFLRKHICLCVWNVNTTKYICFLGMRHDNGSHGCHPGCCLMSPVIYSGTYSWSECSRYQMEQYLRTIPCKLDFLHL